MHGYHIPNHIYIKAKKLDNKISPANIVQKKIKETIFEQNKIKLKTVSDSSVNVFIIIDTFFMKHIEFALPAADNDNEILI